MPGANIVRKVEIKRSARVMQVESLFDLPPSRKSAEEWTVDLPLEENDWNVGLIVGPSGSGKTTVLKEFFGKSLRSKFRWSKDATVVDDFPLDLGIRDVTGLLSSVGFSTPPSWLRPFSVLSTGEQFRVTIARALAEAGDNLVALDEFTSVVDRTVAQIGSAAIAKAVRKRGQQLVVASCHYDIVDWLQPDWTFQPHVNEFVWRSVQRHPPVTITLRRVHHSAWRLFSHLHYLTENMNPASLCWVGFIDDDTPAVFMSVMAHPHPKKPGWRSSRLAVLPDYQGVGIGIQTLEFVAAMMVATGRPYYGRTTSPALIHARAKSSTWKMIRSPARSKTGWTGKIDVRKTGSDLRPTATFQYVGPAQVEAANGFGLIR